MTGGEERIQGNGRHDSLQGNQEETSHLISKEQAKGWLSEKKKIHRNKTTKFKSINLQMIPNDYRLSFHSFLSWVSLFKINYHVLKVKHFQLTGNWLAAVARECLEERYSEGICFPRSPKYNMLPSRLEQQQSFLRRRETSKERTTSLTLHSPSLTSSSSLSWWWGWWRWFNVNGQESERREERREEEAEIDSKQ